MEGVLDGMLRWKAVDARMGIGGEHLLIAHASPLSGGSPDALREIAEAQ